MKKRIVAIFFVSMCACLLAQADRGYPDPYVAASGSGRYYARAIPAPITDSVAYFQGKNQDAGETFVYFVGYDVSGTGKSEVVDRLKYRFNWYASKIYLTSYGGEGCTVVRMGGFYPRTKMLEEDLAIAFYRGGALLKSYSTLDLVGRDSSWRDLRIAGKVQMSSDGYSVIERVVGFVTIEKAQSGPNALYTPPQYGFEIVMHSGDHIVFDLKTGRRIVLLEGESTRPAPYM